VLEIDLPDRRTGWGDAQRAQIAARLASGTQAHWLGKLDSAGVWAEACVRDAWESGLESIVRTMNDERYGAVVHCIGPLVQFSRSKTIGARRLTSEPGEDGRAILDEIGMQAANR